jgi:hypothetical protein
MPEGKMGGDARTTNIALLAVIPRPRVYHTDAGPFRPVSDTIQSSSTPESPVHRNWWAPIQIILEKHSSVKMKIPEFCF